jgi:hypothetical protein
VIKRLLMAVSVLWAAFWLLLAVNGIVPLEGSLLLFAALPALASILLFYVARFVLTGSVFRR